MITRDMIEHREADLWATTQDGKIIPLYDAKLTYEAHNQVCYRLGQREPAFIATSYPDVYCLTFIGLWDDPILKRDDTRLDVNNVRFTIQSIMPATDGTIRYEATGWPIQVAATIPTDDTMFFPEFGEDVGHEYVYDRYDDYS